MAGLPTRNTVALGGPFNTLVDSTNLTLDDDQLERVATGNTSDLTAQALAFEAVFQKLAQGAQGVGGPIYYPARHRAERNFESQRNLLTALGRLKRPLPNGNEDPQ